MTDPIPVIDLFSGPGGLAEGFCPCSLPLSERRYKIVLSVEKEQNAHRTLLLRSFLRQFEYGPPHEYYKYLNSSTHDPMPRWEDLYPKEWQAARRETVMLELGSPESMGSFDRKIQEIKKEHRGRTVVIGGPPCQAYSLVGRARVAGMKKSASNDPRIFLYQQYVEVVSTLRPMIAVMENVKGIISSSVDGGEIFPQILNALRDADGKNSYRLHALTPSGNDIPFDELLKNPSEFIVRAENHGVPQARHRVFIVCIRSDLAEKFPVGEFPELERRDERSTVKSVIGDMPGMRSGLSRSDNSEAWRTVMGEACDKVKHCLPASAKVEKDAFADEIDRVRESINTNNLERSGGGELHFQKSSVEFLRWLYDENLRKLPNNETRGHMPEDLERYLFAAVFAKTLGRSPQSHDFPIKLAPHHRSWTTKKFADRFRVQLANQPAKTITSHISKDGHYFIHYDPAQCRSLTVREAARLQTFPDNYLFMGNRTSQYVQVGNAVPPFLAHQIANCLWKVIERCGQDKLPGRSRSHPELILKGSRAEALQG